MHTCARVICLTHITPVQGLLDCVSDILHHASHIRGKRWNMCETFSHILGGSHILHQVSHKLHLYYHTHTHKHTGSHTYHSKSHTYKEKGVICVRLSSLLSCSSSVSSICMACNKCNRPTHAHAQGKHRRERGFEKERERMRMEKRENGVVRCERAEVDFVPRGM